MSKKDENIEDQFIDLEKRGRIFPSWVLMNFKKYKLPAIMKKDNEDPCNVKNTKLELRKYQKFAGAFLDYRSPYRNILIYHGLGSGKTATAINVYNVLFNFSPNWNVFIIIPARLRKNPWITDLDMFLEDKNKKDRMKNVIFVHYDSPFADRDFLDAVKKADSSKRNLYIFDEAHNFIKNVFNNLVSKQGKRASVIYNYIKDDVKENETSRVILLSGTPAVNDPFELSLIFNLLRPKIFPMSLNKFTDTYISNNKLLPDKKNMFQRRILGLVSYYLGATPDLFAEKRVHFKNLKMDDYHEEVYNHFEEVEKKLERKAAINRTQSNVYRSYTRQASNFVFPAINSKVNGEARPRPGQFRLSESDLQKLEKGLEFEKDIKEAKKQASVTRLQEYNFIIKKFLSDLKDYFNKIKEKDSKTSRNIKKDIEEFKTTYKGKFSEFWKKHKNKSELLKALYASSCKMTAILFYLLRSKGPAIVYSNYVRMEGLEIFQIYMDVFGYSDYYKGKGKDGMRYIKYTGDISRDKREEGRKVYNNKKNITGDMIKVMLISPAGSEGISLLNVRQVHIMEPYWHEVRIDQLIGRAVRACSHKDLPIKERYVDIFRYKAVRDKNRVTTDEDMERLAFEKKDLIETFLKTMREAAVDCELFKEQNKILGDYNCFNFNLNDITEEYVGPAYIQDLEQDTKINSGLDAVNTISKSANVYKVKALKKKGGDKLYYWYDPKTKILFDYDLNYPLGKVKVDSYGIPEKEGEAYIIGKLFNIPKLNIVN